MQNFEEQIGILLALAQTKEDVSDLINEAIVVFAQEFKIDNAVLVLTPYNQDLHQDKIKTLIAHLIPSNQAQLLWYCKNILMKNENYDFALAILTQITAPQQKTDLETVRKDILDCPLDDYAIHLEKLFSLATLPENWDKASHLLAQFYEPNLIDNEQCNTHMIQFRNLFVPFSDDIALNRPQRFYLKDLFFSPDSSKKNIHLGLHILEYIFPTRIDEIDLELLTHIVKLIKTYRSEKSITNKIDEILEFAQNNVNFTKDSDTLIKIGQFRTLINMNSLKPTLRASTALSLLKALKSENETTEQKFRVSF